MRRRDAAGTWMSKKEEVREAVKQAAFAGILRHFDTAAEYKARAPSRMPRQPCSLLSRRAQVEDEVGGAIKELRILVRVALRPVH